MQRPHKAVHQWYGVLQHVQSCGDLNGYERFPRLVSEETAADRESLFEIRKAASTVVANINGTFHRSNFHLPSDRRALDYPFVLMRSSEYDRCPVGCFTGIELTEKMLGKPLFEDETLVIVGDPTRLAPQCVCLRGPDNNTTGKNTNHYMHIFRTYSHVYINMFIFECRKGNRRAMLQRLIQQLCCSPYNQAWTRL